MPSLISLALVLLSFSQVILATNEQQCDENMLQAEEKNWMPWPTSLKDPKKDYVTVTLDPVTETEITTTTSTIRVTKTVFSHTTLFTTVETDKTTTSSITEIVNKIVTKTFSSTTVDKITVTSSFSTTTTLTQTQTLTLEDGRPLPPAGNKIIQADKIEEETSIVLKRPIDTSTSTRTNLVHAKTTIRSQTTATLTTTRVVSKTVIEASSVTFSTTIVEREIVSTTVTYFI